jgi:hypothetical protein
MRISAARASSSSGSLFASTASARARSFSSAGGSSGLNTSTRARDRSGAISSKDGFSVVAPTSTTVPSSTTGRKGILLRPVETMNLVDEEKRPLPGFAPAARGVKDSLQIGDAGKDRRDLLEMQIGGLRQSSRATVVLPVPGGPQKDQRAERARFQHPRQRAVRTEQMILADHVGELGPDEAYRRAAAARRARGRPPRTGWAIWFWDASSSDVLLTPSPGMRGEVTVITR